MRIAVPRDLTPLADRLAVLQATRILAAIAVLGVPAVLGDTTADLWPLALGYVGLTVVVEGFRRFARVATPWLVTSMLLADGVFLAFAVSLTGGARSPLLFLMFLDVLAVTLLASYRSGLKIAVWNALLLFMGQAAVRAGVIHAKNPASDRQAALGAAAFLAVAVAAAAFSAINERALRDSRSRLAALVELDVALERARTPSDVGGVLARHAVKLGFCRAVVVTCSANGWERSACDRNENLTTEDAAAPSGPELDAARDATAPRLVKQLDRDDTLNELLPGASNVMVVALVADGDCLGVVGAEWGPERPRIGVVTTEAMSQACAHAALALRNRSLLDEVERLAAGDPLTGLANRRVLEDALYREVERAWRTNGSVSFVVLDLDHFKEINDTEGHLAGDKVLRDVATALASGTKGFDLAARFGGDEFAVLLPGCERHDGPVVAERLRRLAADAMPSGRSSISAGVATLPGDAMDAEGLVAAADRALYTAKREGRARAKAAAWVDAS